MPAVYAHYRFGAEMLKRLPADITGTIKRFRSLYDIGLHGPDIFFFYNPIRPGDVGGLGSKLHHQSGKEVLTRICRRFLLEPTDAGLAYLYGFLCHYCLDISCHPLVNGESRGDRQIHGWIEGEFDRFLMEKDNKPDPHRQDVSKHIHLTREACELVSNFYPGTEGKHIQQCLRNMALVKKAVAIPTGAAREKIKDFMISLNKGTAGMFIPQRPVEELQQMNQMLFAHYQQAKELLPRLLMQLNAHLTYHEPLGEDFTSEFG